MVVCQHQENGLIYMFSVNMDVTSKACLYFFSSDTAEKDGTEVLHKSPPVSACTVMVKETRPTDTVTFSFG